MQRKSRVAAYRQKGAAGLERALGTEFFEAPIAAIGGDEGGDSGGE